MLGQSVSQMHPAHTVTGQSSVIVGVCHNTSDCTTILGHHSTASRQLWRPGGLAGLKRNSVAMGSATNTAAKLNLDSELDSPVMLDNPADSV